MLHVTPDDVRIFNPTQALVLAVMRGRADDSGIVTITGYEIASATGLSYPQVRSALDALVGCGALVVLKRGRGYVRTFGIYA